MKKLEESINDVNDVSKEAKKSSVNQENVFELTNYMEQYISKKMRLKSTKEQQNILVDINKISVTRYDLKTLQCQNWVNDRIIYAYLCLLCLKSKQKIFSIDPLIFKVLERGDFSKACKFHKGVNMLQFEKIFIPINYPENHHWFLCLVDLKKNIIQSFDSLDKIGRHEGILRTISDFFTQKYSLTYKFDLQCDCDIPMQENSFDCGVFTMLFADCLSRNSPFDFKQADIPRLRKIIMYEILTKSIVH